MPKNQSGNRVAHFSSLARAKAVRGIDSLFNSFDEELSSADAGLLIAAAVMGRCGQVIEPQDLARQLAPLMRQLRRGRRLLV